MSYIFSNIWSEVEKLAAGTSAESAAARSTPMKLHDDDFCEICFSNDVEDDQIIFCDKCNSAVHLQCAHLPESVVDETMFICDTCKRGRTPCALCGGMDPLHMVCVYPGVYAHTLCYRMCPFPFDFDALEQSPGVSLEVFQQRCLADVCCQICSRPGLVLDCAEVGCRKYAHPSCFVASGGVVTVLETADAELIRVRCKLHSAATETTPLCLWPISLLKGELRETRKLKQQRKWEKDGRQIGVVGQRQFHFQNKEGQQPQSFEDWKRQPPLRELNAFQQQILICENVVYERGFYKHPKLDSPDIVVVPGGKLWPQEDSREQIDFILVGEGQELHYQGVKALVSLPKEPMRARSPRAVSQFAVDAALIRGAVCIAEMPAIQTYSYSAQWYDPRIERDVTILVCTGEQLGRYGNGKSYILGLTPDVLVDRRLFTVE